MIKIPGYWGLKGQINNLYLKLFINSQIDEKQHYMIFSDPRGGSTWLTEVVNQIVKVPIIWEPLDLHYNKNFADLGFGFREFIPEHEKNDLVRNEFQALFKGRRLNYYNASQISIRHLQKTRNFLIKFCRGNTLLPWLTENFKFKYQPIYLVRHPMAVVSSQLKHGAWSTPYRGFTLPSKLFSDLYNKHEDFISSIKTVEESCAVVWCVTNKYLLEHEKNNTEWVTIFYEDLFLNPEENIDAILRRWDIDYDLNDVDFRKPSRMTKGNSPTQNITQLSQWQSNLSNDQIKRILSVMEYFEIRHYSQEILPTKNA